MPVVTVERTGFKKFCERVIPDVSVPSRRTLVRNVGELYKTEKKALMDELQKVRFVSCTADM